MKEMTMNEMMDVNGGHYSKRIEKPTSNEEANRFARDAVIVVTVGGGAVACGAGAVAAGATTALAAGGDRMLNQIP